MKLSQLVYYLNNLDTVNIDSVEQNALRELDHVRYLMAETGPDIGTFAQDINTKYATAASSIKDLGHLLQDLRNHIKQRIETEETAYFEESTRLYRDEMCWETADYILNRRMSIDNDSAVSLQSRLKNYTDWRLPGLIIRPGLESFVEHMVPLDPLYLVDTEWALLEPCLNQFNEVYRNRLRPYVCTEKSEQILKPLPDAQFGLIFAYNFLNYKPMEIVKNYLQEFYRKLRPGGLAFFTYNDCDQGHGVALAESKLMCYTPRSQLLRYAEQIGFDLYYEHRGLGNLVWMELKKPGEIVSLRGSQTLAKIIVK